MKCRKCDIEFIDLTHPNRNRGICKDCANERWREYRKQRIESKNPLRVKKMPAEYHGEYYKKWCESNRDKVCEYAKKAREKSPEKAKARETLNKALKKGLVIKSPCAVCGSMIVDGHHHDYKKPLDVLWMCRKHHKELHKKATT